MARPTKEGIEYFPLDVVVDDKVKLIDAKFGIAGFGVLIKLWQIIYDNGYYATWGERELLLYKTRINADINLINDIINECLKWGIFNNDLYERYSILTSSGIQKRYFEAVKRRTEITLTAEYLLADLPANFKPNIVTITPVNVDNNSKNDNSGTQSKVNKSKVNKSIIMQPDEAKYISTLESIDGYPIDREKDIAYYHELEKRYPGLDLIEMVKDWAAYKLDHPLSKKDNPRAQINTQCKLNIKWGKNLIPMARDAPQSKYRDMTNYEPGGN